MMRSVKITLLGLAAILLVGLLAIALLVPRPGAYPLPAAGAPVLAEGSALPPGYESLEFNGKGVRASYASQGRRISFETARGPANPWLMRMDPGTPLFAIDVRFVGEDGAQFLTQFGGDGPMDGSWDPALHVVENVDVPAEEAQARFSTAAQALESLRQVRFREELTPEHEALVGLAEFARSMGVAEEPQ